MSESNILIPTVAQVEERIQKYTASKIMEVVSRAAEALRNAKRLPVSVSVEKMYLYPEERVTIIEMFKEKGWECSISSRSACAREASSITVNISKAGKL